MVPPHACCLLEFVDVFNREQPVSIYVSELSYRMKIERLLTDGFSVYPVQITTVEPGHFMLGCALHGDVCVLLCFGNSRVANNVVYPLPDTLLAMCVQYS